MVSDDESCHRRGRPTVFDANSSSWRGPAREKRAHILARSCRCFCFLSIVVPAIALFIEWCENVPRQRSFLRDAKSLTHAQYEIPTPLLTVARI